MKSRLRYYSFSGSTLPAPLSRRENFSTNKTPPKSYLNSPWCDDPSTTNVAISPTIAARPLQVSANGANP